MNYTKNRLRWLFGGLAVNVLLLFALWVNSGFAPLTEEGKTQRLARQYMLSEFEPVERAPEGELLYISGDELVQASKFGRLYFYPLEGRAAFVPDTAIFYSPYNEDPNCKAMELYAYDEIEGAENVELEFWLRDELSENNEVFEATYTPRCTEYRDGLAIFLLEQSEISQQEYSAFYDLSVGAQFGKVTNGISFCATLRYYDAAGNLLDEVVREMLWK